MKKKFSVYVTRHNLYEDSFEEMKLNDMRKKKAHKQNKKTREESLSVGETCKLGYYFQTASGLRRRRRRRVRECLEFNFL